MYFSLLYINFKSSSCCRMENDSRHESVSLSVFFRNTQKQNGSYIKVCTNKLHQPIILRGERFAHAHHTAPRGNPGTKISPLLEASLNVMDMLYTYPEPLVGRAVHCLNTNFTKKQLMAEVYIEHISAIKACNKCLYEVMDVTLC